MGNHSIAVAKLGPRLLLLVAITVAICALGIAAITTGTSAAETPAERCQRETNTYNTTWKQAWVATHPGKSIDDAPAPNPPYKCGENNTTPPPSITTTSDTPTPSSASPSSSGNASTTPRVGPSLNPPASTSNPAAGVTPGQPTINSDTAARSSQRGSATHGNGDKYTQDLVVGRR
ncbi:hypothetical protein [Gordonia sp. CPCC 205333]|uniref:hypothetical protein n=1 Tax=Gordonia sp. CPCC 205333 TaxID=3140790 RepID=UPI003AF364BD